MNWALPQSASRKSNRVVPVSPKVKSAKTCKLANNDRRNFDRTAKSVDPIVYNSVTVELTGLFENVETKMERAVAIKKLGKILGKSLGYRVDPTAPDQDDRDEARAKLKDAAPKRDALSKAVEARRAAVLQADAEYQELKAAHSEAKKCCDELFSTTCHYRFTVGTSAGMFFMVKAQGDSWEEVIGKLTEKQAA